MYGEYRNIVLCGNGSDLMVCVLRVRSCVTYMLNGSPDISVLSQSDIQYVFSGIVFF